MKCKQLITTKAVTLKSFDYELKYVAEFYGDDVDKNNLAIQLNILAADYLQDYTPPSIFSIIDYFKSLSPAKRSSVHCTETHSDHASYKCYQ